VLSCRDGDANAVTNESDILCALQVLMPPLNGHLLPLCRSLEKDFYEAVKIKFTGTADTKFISGHLILQRMVEDMRRQNMHRMLCGPHPQSWTPSKVPFGTGLVVLNAA
jgi:hypothetical protein